jgi:hypothetical protein
MNRYVGDFAPGKTVRLTFNTNKADGTPITLAGTPAVAVYKDSSTTESTTGVTLAVDFDARTGMHQVVIDTSADGTFYAAASDFRAVLTAGTVDSISVVGAVVGGFSLSNRSALRPTTADRTLDVSAGGEAGLDWANVGSPTTTLVLSGTTLGTLTTYTGNTPQTGDNYALASGTSGFVAIKGNTAAIVAKLPTNSIADETLVIAATNSILATLGTPAGASLAADIQTRSTYAGADTAGTTTLLTRVPGAIPFADGTRAALKAAPTLADGTLMTQSASIPATIAAGGIVAASFATGAVDANALAQAAADKVWATTARTITGGTITTYTGNTPQTGDNYALANGTSGFVAIKGNTAAIVAKLPTNSIADETLILAATSSILSAVGTPAQAAQIPANFTTALFASAGVFSTGALANAPTGGGSAQTGDVFGLLNPLVATGAFTAPALANVPKTGYALTSAYDPAKTAAQAGAAMTLTSGERDSVADAFLDRASGVEPGETPRQWMRKVRAVLLGVSTAAGVFKRKDKTTTSVTATLDGQGARTDVVDGTN